MLIKVRNYPQTFEFETQVEFPKFKYGCEMRREALVQAMQKLKVNSPRHAYEDYTVAKIIKRNGLELWFLDS